MRKKDNINSVLTRRKRLRCAFKISCCRDDKFDDLIVGNRKKGKNIRSIDGGTLFRKKPCDGWRLIEF